MTFKITGKIGLARGVGAEEGGVGGPSRVIAVNGPVMRICIQEVISRDLCSLTSSLALPSLRPGTELTFYGL